MKKHLLFALVSFTLIACTSEVTEEDEPTKSGVAQAIADGDVVSDDVCSINGWNDDAVCDSWCPDGDDEDCNIPCPAIAELPDGVCNEDPNALCPTDPDCEDMLCPAISQVADGVCDEDPNAFCPTDPDCPQNQ